MSVRNTVVATFAAALSLTATVGCESGSKVSDQKQNQIVRDDGTAVQTRTRTREADSGAVVQETETRERKVVQPAPGTGAQDATKSDPAK